MKKYTSIKYFIHIFVITCVASSCGTSITEIADPIRKQKNITILLDLSDRIIDQKDRDIQIIDSIYSGFLSFQKKCWDDNSYEVEGLNDRLQIKIAYQINNPSNLRNEYENKLIMNSLSANESRLKEYFNSDIPKFYSNVNQLYNKAYIGNIRQQYFGADIYKYFNEELNPKDLDSNYEYYIVILTDGYMFVSGKQGEDIPRVDILPANKFASKNVHVCLVEVAPKEELDGEINRLSSGWADWFRKMGIEDTKLVKKNKLVTTIEELQKFLGFPISYTNSEPQEIVEKKNEKTDSVPTIIPNSPKVHEIEPQFSDSKSAGTSVTKSTISTSDQNKKNEQKGGHTPRKDVQNPVKTKNTSHEKGPIMDDYPAKK